MSANTCLIAYEDIPAQEENVEVHTALPTPHLVVFKRGVTDSIANSLHSEKATKAIIAVKGCLSIAF